MTQVVDLDQVLQGQEVQTIQVSFVDEDGKLVNIDSDLFQVSHHQPDQRHRRLIDVSFMQEGQRDVVAEVATNKMLGVDTSVPLPSPRSPRKIMLPPSPTVKERPALKRPREATNKMPTIARKIKPLPEGLMRPEGVSAAILRNIKPTNFVARVSERIFIYLAQVAARKLKKKD